MAKKNSMQRATDLARSVGIHVGPAQSFDEWVQHFITGAKNRKVTLSKMATDEAFAPTPPETDEHGRIRTEADVHAAIACFEKLIHCRGCHEDLDYDLQRVKAMPVPMQMRVAAGLGVVDLTGESDGVMAAIRRKVEHQWQNRGFEFSLQNPVRMSGKWTAFQGPRGGHGWKSTVTGRVLYQREMPGEHEHQGDHQDEPAKPSGEKPPEKTAAPKAGAGEKPAKPSGEKPAEGKKPDPALAKEFPAAAEKPTAPPPGNYYHPDVESGKAARVGVPPMEVPPPPPFPKLPNLAPDERAVEQGWLHYLTENTDKATDEYLKMAQSRGNTFETDGVKELCADWSPPKSAGMSEDDVKNNRGQYNLALHQGANAICKRAFLKHLDSIKGSGKPVLVTCGGTGAGKGFMLEPGHEVESVKKVSDIAGAIWDSAGDQNGTENDWIQQECEKRGLKAYYAYVHNNPEKCWADPKRGVVQRANAKGRMIDAHVMADSYAYGAKNMKAFYDKHKDNPNAGFFFVDNEHMDAKGNAQEIPEIPKEALSIDRDALHKKLLETVKERQDQLRPAVVRGATAGLRIWPDDTKGEKKDEPKESKEPVKLSSFDRVGAFLAEWNR